MRDPETGRDDQRLPVTVADPRAWIRFGLLHLPPALGMYALAVLLGVAAAKGGLRVLGGGALVVILAAIGLGLLVGLVAGVVDGMLVWRIGLDQLRLAIAFANASLTVVVVAMVTYGQVSIGWLYPIVILAGPAAVAGVVSYRSSPAARRVEG